MRRRTNQMVGINQPCSTWSQKVCKFELQKMHRWNICCVEFLGRTSSTTFKNSTSRNLTSLSSATSRNKYQAFVFEMCLRLEPLRNTNTCNKNLLQANLASTCFEIRWFLRLASVRTQVKIRGKRNLSLLPRTFFVNSCNTFKTIRSL